VGGGSNPTFIVLTITNVFGRWGYIYVNYSFCMELKMEIRIEFSSGN
jgi:hypothetical protein